MLSEVLERDHVIGSLDQIPPGEGRTFDVAGTLVAVFRTRADAVFATQALCPHRDGPLADGMIGGTVVMCPLHDRSYDLITGKELGGECDIAVYPIRRDPDGSLRLTLPARN